MHTSNGSAEGTLDVTFQHEHERPDPLTSTDRSNQTSEYLRRRIEMAVEWTHLGGD
jgi:hypothetical protein